MELGKFMMRFWVGVLLAVVVLPLWVEAYQPSLDELISKALGKGSDISRMILESRTEVFDPLQAETNAEKTVRIPGVGANEPIVVKKDERTFRQVTYWLRNKMLAVETFSPKGELLHFYFKEGLDPLAINLHKTRKFSQADVLLAYLPFIESHRQGWREGLERWGLQPVAVDLVRATKGRILYRLRESPGKSLWLDRAGFYPVKLHTLIQGGALPQAITIEFFEFMRIEKHQKPTFSFPRTTNYLLNGLLFKQTTVTRILTNPSWRSFPLKRLRDKRQELAAAAVSVVQGAAGLHMGVGGLQ